MFVFNKFFLVWILSEFEIVRSDCEDPEAAANDDFVTSFDCCFESCNEKKEEY